MVLTIDLSNAADANTLWIARNGHMWKYSKAETTGTHHLKCIPYAASISYAYAISLTLTFSLSFNLTSKQFRNVCEGFTVVWGFIGERTGTICFDCESQQHWMFAIEINYIVWLHRDYQFQTVRARAFESLGVISSLLFFYVIQNALLWMLSNCMLCINRFFPN